MPGRIKLGEGTLIGNAGEYYVTAELLKRGVIAALAPRNAPSFDILATKSDKTIRIRVKTKSEQYDVWQWVTKKDGEIFHNLHAEGDFSVLVNLSKETKNLEYFIIPTVILNRWLKKDFDDWASTPGKKGQQRSLTNKKRHLGKKKYYMELEKYHDNWEILWA